MSVSPDKGGGQTARLNRTAAASRAGKACLAKHGKDFYRRIGKLGYQTTLARHWQGDALGYRKWLIARGWNACVDQLADRELDRRLAGGERVACIEIPVLDEDGPDCDQLAEESTYLDFHEAGLPF